MINSARLETVLDACVTAVLEQGQSATDCLAQYPDERDVLEPLLRTGLRLRAASAVRPSPEFRQVAAVRMQNLLAAHPRQRRPAAAPPVTPGWREWFRLRRRAAWAGVLGLVLAFWLFLGGALAYASNDALPGETLYSVKQAVEEARLSLAAQPTAAVRLHLQFAARRLAEAERLAALGNTAVSRQTLAAYEAEVTAALSLLADAALTPAEREAAAQLAAAELERQAAALEDWPAAGEMDTAVRQARQLSQDGRLTAFQIMGKTPPDDWLPPAAATATATPSQTPSPTATATGTPTPTNTATASPTATPQPPTATPTPVWLIPPDWPAGCPVPGDWPEDWPPDCPIPTAWPEGWPTPPGGWPVATPLPTLPPLPTIPPLPTFAVPPDWPEGCPVPPDLPEEWPENCPIPTAWPEGWPTPPGNWQPPPGGWPTPPPGDWPTPPPGNWQPPNIPTPPAVPNPGDVTIPSPPSWP